MKPTNWVEPLVSAQPVDSRLAEITLLSLVLQVLAHESEPKQVFRRVVEAIADTLRFPIASLYLLEGDELVMQHQVGYAAPYPRFKLNDGVISRAARTGQAQILKDVRLDPDYIPAEDSVLSEIAVPIKIGETVAGVLNLESRQVLDEHVAELVNTIAKPLALLIERTQLNQRVEHLAYYDFLTGLPNRVQLQNHAERLIAQSQREAIPFSLLYLDLDRFKEVNDSLGHRTGDQLLLQVAERLQAVSRQADFQARLGGDEFAFLLAGVDAGQAVAYAERVLEVLHQPFVLGHDEVHIGGSIGIATFPHDGENLESLMQSADIAMYQAKALGGGWRLYSPEEHRHSRERLLTLQALRGALENGELVLHYQPILDISSHLYGRYEVLVRWQRAGVGMVPPAAFIPLAEETGLIRQIDLYVLEKALLEAQNHSHAISVNLSPRSFHHPEFFSHLLALLGRYPLPKGGLWLEITESALMQEHEQAKRELQNLQRLGIKTALDDFGTGYSSLSYLKHLPVDLLKIDRSFVAGIGNPKDESILRSMIELGHGLELQVLAEGVETAEQLEWLTRSGCDLAQGYHLGRPGPLKDGHKA